MQLDIKAQGIELLDRNKDSIAKELEKVDRMLPDNLTYTVNLSKLLSSKGILFSCDITVNDCKCIIKGKGVSDIFSKSIDLAVLDLKNKLKSVKARLLFKEDCQKPKYFDDMLEKVEIKNHSKIDNEELFRESENIFKRKVFNLEPMTEVEAILQMELLGHSFFVFKDMAGCVSILYKRKVGYGLIRSV